MIAACLHRLHHDAGWTAFAAITLAAFGAALIVLAYTTGRPSQ